MEQSLPKLPSEMWLMCVAVMPSHLDPITAIQHVARVSELRTLIFQFGTERVGGEILITLITLIPLMYITQYSSSLLQHTSLLIDCSETH